MPDATQAVPELVGERRQVASALGRSVPTANGRGLKVESGMLSDRLPPQHLEAERGVLGSILLDNEVMHDIVVFLAPRISIATRIR